MTSAPLRMLVSITAASGLVGLAVNEAPADPDPDPELPSEKRGDESRVGDSTFEVGLEFNGFTYANLSVGYWHGRVGVNLSGGYIGSDSNDIRVDLGYRFYDKGHWRHALHLLGGNTVGSDPGADYDYSYVGLAYELNYRGFYTLLGLGKDIDDRIGNLDEDPVIPTGALIGYQYRF